MMAVLDLEQKK